MSEEGSGKRHQASKIKSKLKRLHRTRQDTSHESDESRVFTDSSVERPAPPQQPNAFTRAENPEDDFIITTHPFVPSTDHSIHGLAPFDSALPWKTPERIVGLDRQVERHKIAFFDIETSGLRNTDPIICAALGYWLDHHPADMFHVKHYFIFHPRAEANMLRAMLADLCAFEVLCTYNGKSFDVPRVKSRCTQFGLDPVGITRQKHADLVHTSRRMLPKQNHKLNLATMEQTLLGFTREHDLPGSEVPRRWQHFLMKQDLTMLDEIRDHNLLDVVSLAALIEIFAQGGPGFSAGLVSDEPQQTLPLAQSKPARKKKVAPPPPQPYRPPSQAEAMSPLQRKLARSYKLKSKSNEEQPQQPVVRAEPKKREQPQHEVALDKSDSHDDVRSTDTPSPGQQVGPRVAQLRALISAKLKEDQSCLRSSCMPLVTELVALDPHHTQGLKWLIQCYKELGAHALVKTLQARYDAQNPYG